jgi:VanZ family protein
MREPHFRRDRVTNRSRLRRYLPLVLWMALVFFASTGEFSASNTNLLIQPFLRWLFPQISNERVAFVHFLIRKCGHFSEYAILSLLAARTFITSSRAGFRRSWFVAALVLVCLYALSDEYHQSFVASRSASIYDSLIDTLGGFTALALMFLWRKRKAPDRGR